MLLRRFAVIFTCVLVSGIAQAQVKVPTPTPEAAPEPAPTPPAKPVVTPPAKPPAAIPEPVATRSMNSVSWCGVGDNPVSAVVSLHQRVMSTDKEESNLLLRDAKNKTTIVNVANFRHVEVVSIVEHKKQWYACGVLRE